MAVTTRGDLIRHISLEFGLDRTDASDEQLLMVDWAQDAVYDFLLETRVRLTSVTLNLVSGQGVYSFATLGATILGITDATITSGGNKYDLERVSLAEILDWRRTSQAADRVRKYAAEGDLLAVYPTPSSADTITAYVITKPTAMDTDARDFTTSTYGGIPAQHSPVLLAYMRWRAAVYDERKLPDPPAQLRIQYEQLLAEARRRIRRMGGRSIQGMRPGYPGVGGNPGQRNDTYPS